jgi:hypothetical protein
MNRSFVIFVTFLWHSMRVELLSHQCEHVSEKHD